MSGKCDLLGKDGMCKKWRTPSKCRRMEPKDFDGRLACIAMEDVCRQGSIFGNQLFTITKEQLAHLMNGGVLYAVDEYGMFIRLDRDSRQRNEA